MKWIRTVVVAIKHKCDLKYLLSPELCFSAGWRWERIAFPGGHHREGQGGHGGPHRTHPLPTFQVARHSRTFAQPKTVASVFYFWWFCGIKNKHSQFAASVWARSCRGCLKIFCPRGFWSLLLLRCRRVITALLESLHWRRLSIDITHAWDIQNIPNPMVLTGCALIHSNSWNFLISQAWHSPRQDMEDLFHYLDVDGTGTLSQNEFIEGRLMAACRTLLAHDYLTTEWTYLEICVAYTRKSVLIPWLQTLGPERHGNTSNQK